MRIYILVLALLGLLACSQKVDGPTPVVTGVAPNLICTAQADTTIEITGSGFSPVVIDTLTDTPSVQMPSVVFVAAGGSDEIPSTHVSLPAGNTAGTALEVVIPQSFLAPTTAGDPDRVYDVRVINPNGNEGSLAGALTVVGPPALLAVDPSSGAQGKTVVVALTGAGFRDGMTVTLDANPAVTATDVVVTSSTAATATFDLTGVAPGVYAITVTNAEGCSATLPDAFTVYVSQDFALTGIDPPFGCTCTDTTVTITSAGGFVSTPRVEMRPAGQSSPIIEFRRVAFIDANTLTAVVPAGAALGDYDVTVYNPPSNGGIGTLPNGFRVVASPIPTIEEIVPSRGSPTANTPVSIYGENFRDPVRIELIDPSGSVDALVDNVTPVSSTRIDATLPTSGMTEDIYLLRVTNLDEMTYSTYSSFQVASTGPSGNLHTFTSEPMLVTGRRLLAGASARDPLGNRFVYAIGGDTGAGGTVLGSVEVSQLSKFGRLAAWQDSRNQLITPRTGASAVAVPLFDPAGSPFVPVKTYLYVLGGTSDDGTTVLDSIERAVVLSPDDAPTITSIASSATASTLAAGTWYYKVSAVLGTGDPDNPGGETLASDEEIITIAANRSVELAWNPVTVNGMAAVSYRIYRTDQADGTSQTEHLIATVTTTSYTDSGAAPGTESPLPPGAVGVWVAAGNLATARWGHQAATVSDPNGARFVYALGGKSDATTGYLASVEYAAVNADGSLGTFDSTGASPLPVGRAFFSLAVETPENVSGFAAGARLFAVGGVTASMLVNKASGRFEYADVAVGGGTTAWSSYGGAGTLGTRAGPMACITSDKLFVLGGAQMATDTGFSNVTATGVDVPFQSDGTIGSPIQSTASSLLAPRALGAVVTGAGFIYFIGGSSNGTNALATTERTF